MKAVKLNIVLLLCFLIHWNCFSQFQNKTDSLENLLPVTKVDSIKVDILNKLFLVYEFEDDEQAEKCLNKALEISQRSDYKKGLAVTYIYLGYFAEDKCNYPEAIKNYLASLAIEKSIGDNEGMASAYNSIGNVCYHQGNYPEALKNYFASLKLREAIGNKTLIATSYNNIGLVYTNQGNYSEAFKNYFASLKIMEAFGDNNISAATYNNIGNAYNLQDNYPEALKNYFASLKIKERLGDNAGIASSYGNIGSVYSDQGNYPEALKNYFASLKIEEELGDKARIASSYYGIGYVYSIQNKYKDAYLYYSKAIDLSKEIGYKDCLLGVYKALTGLDYGRGNYKGAYENHLLYILYRDSIDNEETRKKTIQTQLTYDFDKKEAVAQAEHKKELENQKVLAEEKSRKQSIVILFVAIGLLLVIVFAGFIFRSLKNTRRQKLIIEKQKIIVDEKNIQLNQQNEEISAQRDEIETQRDEIEAQRDLVTEQKESIEEIHKEVTDSINYAKRIQEAVLPVSDFARSVLGEHFILFKPKDIVSGDFYWTIKINNLLFVAAADCTGHGVPGAFMSMLGISFLNEIVQKQEINKANQILNILRKEIINALQQKGVQGEQKDGMDISLLVINTDTNQFQWAGANNPLYIVTDCSSLVTGEANQQPETSNQKLIELKPDKMPIAIYPEMKDFTNHEFNLQKGDCFYLFTDGFADQFGGPNEKKFMYKRFKELLVSIAGKPMTEQKEILDNAFENWRGKHEQIDDVTILGIKI